MPSRFWLLVFAFILFIVLAILLFAGAGWESFRHVIACVCVIWAIVVAALLAGSERPRL